MRLSGLALTAAVASPVWARSTAVVRQILLTMSAGKGKAKHKTDRGKRELEVEVEKVTVPVGTLLTVTYNSVTIGTMKVALVLGVRKAKLSLSTERGQSVPVLVAGDVVAVLNGSTTIGTGTF